MMSNQKTFPALPARIFKYAPGQIEEIIIPYSTANLERLNYISGFSSPYLQDILAYYHDNFEIHILVETFPILKQIPFQPLDGSEPGSIQVEKIFIQFIALYEAARSHGLDFIDFSRFCLDLDDAGEEENKPSTNRLIFPVLLTGKKEPSLSTVLAPFQAYEIFRHLDEKNYKEMFTTLGSQFKFAEPVCHLYHLADFTSAGLNAFSQRGTGKDRAVKARVKIEAMAHHQENIIKRFLYRNLVLPDTFFISFDRHQKGTLSTTAVNLLPAETLEEAGAQGGLDNSNWADPGTYAKITKALKIHLQKSAADSLVIFADTLKTREDNEFINLLFDSLGADVGHLLAVVFSSDDTVDFDLKLKEDPPNLLAKYLKFFDIAEVKELTQQEKDFLKVFKAIPLSLSRKALERFFTKEECRLVEHLVKKKYLKSIPGKILLNESYPGLNIPLSEDEKQGIRRRYLDKFDSINVLVREFIETGKSSTLNKKFKKFLEERLAKGDGHIDMRRVFFENIDFLQGKRDFLELFADLFIKEGDLVSARQALGYCKQAGKNGKDKFSLFAELKMAHIHHLEENYPLVTGLLGQVSAAGYIPPELLDEYHYLRYVETCHVSGYREAAHFLKKIDSRFYLNLARITLADNLRRRGEYAKARQMLEETIAYFDEEGHHREKLTAQNRLAQVLQEDQQYETADHLYKSIYIESEIKPYPLLLGYIALGHGDLYLEQGQFYQARNRYKKALKIFTGQDNQNGQMTAQARQSRIDFVDGNWLEAGTTLKTILKYDRLKHRQDAEAWDLCLIARLEGLRNNFSKALEFAETAAGLFKQGEHILGMADADFLKYFLLCFAGNPRPGLNFFHSSTNAENLSGDRAVVYAILQMLENKISPSGEGARDETQEPNVGVKNIRLLVEKLEEVKSPILTFDLLIVLISRYRHPVLLEKLRTLSMKLSKGTRNWYFYEYHYIYYRYYLPGDLQGEQQDIFLDTYTFFSRNKRRLASGLNKLKQSFDEQESSYDIFDSARLVEDYRTWKMPGDFFKDFVKELDRLIQPDLVHLVIYRKTGEKKTRPIFDFSTEKKFSQLTSELITLALEQASNLDLSLEQVREKCRNEEKVFYTFGNTKLILWPISSNLYGVICLAFLDATYYHQDFERRGRQVLDKFAQLFERYYQKDAQKEHQLGFIIGDSLAMTRVKEQIIKVGKVDFPVLVTGESGTGKELIAQAIHRVSPRSSKPFIPVNSAAIPENLLEAELFGYKKGAFTGANENRTGLIEAADLGTLFLDEIGDLPMGLQAKLLRALQEGEIRRLGENRTIKVDFRLISATNKDLKALVQKSSFREDLYYRIEVLQIKIPPLRDRVEDIPLLARHFLEKNHFPVKDPVEFQGIVEYLKSREWTGNVRELESSIKRLITYYPDFEIGETVAYKEDYSLKKAKENLERIMVIRTLRETGWNKIKTMQKLKISRMYLYNLMKKYNIPMKQPDADIDISF